METPEVPGKQLSEEAQLLREGRQLVKRAVDLSTQTHKIKVWVPILCSMILTGYYLYGLHRKQANAMDLAQPVTPAPAAVADDEGANPKAAGAAPADAAQPEAPVAEGGDSPADVRKRAQQAHAAKQFAEEAKLWQQFMDGPGAAAEACPAIGQAYERAGQLDDSIKAFEKCRELEPGNVDTLVAFAHALESKRDFDRASGLYREVLAKDAKNLDAQTGLALVELKQDHLRAAEQAALNVLHKAPDQTDALLITGIVAWRESRLPEAERIFRRGAALDDRRADFHAFLGRIAEAERRPEDALRQYEKALALDPSDADISERRERLEQQAR